MIAIPYGIAMEDIPVQCLPKEVKLFEQEKAEGTEATQKADMLRGGLERPTVLA